jgi:hypothetical protein
MRNVTFHMSHVITSHPPLACRVIPQAGREPAAQLVRVRNVPTNIHAAPTHSATTNVLLQAGAAAAAAAQVSRYQIVSE